MKQVRAAEVMSARLVDAVIRWNDKFDGAEKDMVSRIIHALNEIAEGKR